ncbi:hypothetical protein [Flavobacterium commune]|uniref:DUF5689 domain-containing protein n=1 Tax=Flavobacterium commune TaxID=1306519 RepID=A0A1D9P7P0_9FLAO|nr:hypothetical protein [Flavobacterium commune]AOZ98598.1 hypothetical protein BIW12_03620 [Flavobacterium commune]
MKKIQHIITILCLLFLLPCCENDGGDSKISTQKGALPNIQKLENSDSFIDLVAVQNNQEINLGFSVDLAIGKISSMDIIGLYIKSDGTIIKATLASNITSFPVSFNLNRNDLYDAFENLNSSEDFATGDQLIISADITLKDGTVLKIMNDDGTNNFSSNIATSNLYKVFQTYNVSCPSYLAGTYNYSTTNIGDGSYFTSDVFTGTVTFEDQGGGVYIISDGTFGGYTALYDETAIGVELKDICNQISFQGSNQYGDTFTMSNLVVNGNKLTFHWETSFGEFGDTTLTRTDNTNWPNLTL